MSIYHARPVGITDCPCDVNCRNHTHRRRSGCWAMMVFTSFRLPSWIAPCNFGFIDGSIIFFVTLNHAQFLFHIVEPAASLVTSSYLLGSASARRMYECQFLIIFNAETHLRSFEICQVVNDSSTKVKAISHQDSLFNRHSYSVLSYENRTAYVLTDSAQLTFI